MEEEAGVGQPEDLVSADPQIEETPRSFEPALEMDEPALVREVRQKKQSDTATTSRVREPALELDQLAATQEARQKKRSKRYD
ncbi:hypothetical protein Droror1_Dr00025595 [Drosera rotundifolia]